MIIPVANSNINRLQVEMELLIEAAGDLVLRINEQKVVTKMSQRGLGVIGISELPNDCTIYDLINATDHEAMQHAITQAIEVGKATRARVRVSILTGEIWIEFQVMPINSTLHQDELLLVGRDITEMIHEHEQLRFMATHDVLTGLPNRSLMSDRLAMALAQSRRNGAGFAVAAIDFDGFKKVNDGLGHAVGDALLKLAAARMQKCLRTTDTLARVGGDEFVVIMPGVTNEIEIRLITGRIISSIHSPFEIQNHTVHIGTSIGVALFPEHGEDEDKLLSHADTALYRVKETGKGRYVLFNKDQMASNVHELSLEAAMFQAIRDGEFCLHYQPIYEASTRTIKGFEALMRWIKPGMDSIQPAQFISIAESNGLINLLGAWALKASCAQIKIFEDWAGYPLYVTVNVSPRQFRKENFLKVVDLALGISGLPGERLMLEITEGTLMSDPQFSEGILKQLQNRKVRIAIDDFGTGYSSLSYLKKFPISILKIDQSFVRELPHSRKDAAICSTILDLANHLQISVVAEGVETEAQLQFLNDHNCHAIQGHLIAQAMAPTEIMTLMKESKFPESRQVDHHNLEVANAKPRSS